MLKFGIRDLTLFFWGCLISVCSFLFIFLIEYAQETYIFNCNITFWAIVRAIGYCLSVALLEEFLFRFLFLKKWIMNKAKPFDRRVVYLGVGSSLLFGFLHLNLDEFPAMQINMALSGASLFFAAYVFRSLGIAVGMHFSWNIIQGVIFPFEGSGSNLDRLFVFRDASMRVFPEASQLYFVPFFVELILISGLWWKTRT
ncbi:CPBP family intramembrane glutamic endopeptidase [Mangrovibacterium marinum]|uniref:CAAX prenyl protease-like protein n=1 Tax=Mangrovibacterium marinum TaxID=1639118 RepID=A0A2T5C6C1_9BACT|nr:CPBP family intramembrane glutamic endopeptidase [Mangrovibacterium marinum]PTN10442.1 CAAX prenyl protease-like protein [Mangrovibacterium marinum]